MGVNWSRNQRDEITCSDTPDLNIILPDAEMEDEETFDIRYIFRKGSMPYKVLDYLQQTIEIRKNAFLDLGYDFPAPIVLQQAEFGISTTEIDDEPPEDDPLPTTMTKDSDAEPDVMDFRHLQEDEVGLAKTEPSSTVRRRNVSFSPSENVYHYTSFNPAYSGQYVTHTRIAPAIIKMFEGLVLENEMLRKENAQFKGATAAVEDYSMRWYLTYLEAFRMHATTISEGIDLVSIGGEKGDQLRKDLLGLQELSSIIQNEIVPQLAHKVDDIFVKHAK